MSRVIDNVIKLIEAPAEDMGLRIVQVRFYEPNKRRTLQIMAERIADGGMDVDDCAKLSRTISAILDVHDEISGAYHLEVSSPGIDRPLTRLEDFDTYKGFDAKLETKLAVNGRRRFTGLAVGVEAEKVLIEVDGEIHEIAFSNITQAKLILTDRLIKAHQEKYADSGADASLEAEAFIET